jgi:hypothetical protein
MDAAEEERWANMHWPPVGFECAHSDSTDTEVGCDWIGGLTP